MAIIRNTIILMQTAKEKLTTPVLTDLSADGVCKFSFPNDTRAYAYKVFVDGTEQGYGTKWSAELADGIYTVTMNDACFPTVKTYSITAQAYSKDGTYQDSDISAPLTFKSIAQLATPTIAMNADGKTLEITDVANATSYDIYVDGTYKANVAKTVSKTITFVGAKTDFLGGSETYAKIGSAPTSNSDKEYSYSNTGTYEFTGSVDVYIWGDTGTNSGMYELNGTSQTNYVRVNGWSSPTKLTISEDTTICLYQAEMM